MCFAKVAISVILFQSEFIELLYNFEFYIQVEYLSPLLKKPSGFVFQFFLW